MRLQRFYTAEHEDVYSALDFRRLDFDYLDESGDTEKTLKGIEVPADWDFQSIQILCTQVLCQSGIPAKLKIAREPKVPEWLRSRIADDDAVVALPEDERYGHETSAKQIFDRIAGAWVHAGWAAGYFDGEEDARIFYDEVRYMLASQLISPSLPQWKKTGLSWAYGMEGASLDGYRVVAAADGVAPVKTDLAFPDIATLNKSNSYGHAHGLMNAVRKLDQRLGIEAETPEPPAPRPITVDLMHAEAEPYINWQQDEQFKLVAMAAGTRMLRAQLENIRHAAQAEDGGAGLARAIKIARAIGVPENMIDLARRGGDFSNITAPETDWLGETLHTSGNNVAPYVELPHATMRGLNGHDQEIAHRWHQLESSIWRTGKPGAMYLTNIAEWLTCKKPHAQLSFSQQNGFLFHADTACMDASLNALLFRKQDGSFDLQGFEHTTRLLTIALDIALGVAGYAGEDIARNTGEYRPLNLSLANLHPLLLSQAIAYDSEAGRAYAAAVTAIMTAQAFVTSSELAAKLGAFTAFAHDRDNMLRVIRNNRRAVYGETTAYENISAQPLPLNLGACPDGTLVAAARTQWDQALELGHTYGYRNAHISSVAAASMRPNLLGADTAGIEPLSQLVQIKQSGTETFRRELHGAVIDGLGQLGYDPAEVKLLHDYTLGVLTLRGAPCINHATLLEHGLTYDAIDRVEDALLESNDIRFAITPWQIGVDYCTEKLGFDAEQLEDPAFDLLGALGFAEADIMVANAYCYGHGTLADAPELKPEHRPVFACAPEGIADHDDGISAEGMLCMAAQVQPFVTGNACCHIILPQEAGQQRVHALLQDAWRYGLKLLQITRDATWLDRPAELEMEAGEAMEAAAPANDDARPPAPEAATPISAVQENAKKIRAMRARMPDRRKGYTQKAIIGGHKVYLRTGEYEEGGIGEIFIDMHKEGAAFRSLMNNFAIAVSLGLQYGVPLEDFVEAFTFTRFEPAGVVEGNETIKMATSVLDYVFRELAISYLGRQDLANVKPHDLLPDALGRGHREGDLPSGETLAEVRRLASTGYMRANLRLLPTGGSAAADGARLKVRISDGVPPSSDKIN
ncbi:MAG: vitamin B12-dependent ribonucleotide reductase [Alphaproteobacteria bacterium]|nr:vitamin B12-dependent ribonucleotide reductase [Alphaproteobacteria bacterium]